MEKIKVFIIENEAILADSMKTELESHGYFVAGVEESAELALERFEVLKAEGGLPDVVFMDIQLSGKIDGVQAAETINSQFGCAIIFITGFSNKDVFERAFSTRPRAFLLKPFDINQAGAAIKTALYHKKLETELREAKRLLEKQVKRQEIEIQEKESGLQEEMEARGKMENMLARLHTAVEQAADGIIVCDQAGYIEYANPAFENITGFKSGRGDNICDFFGEPSEEDFNDFGSVWQAVSDGSAWRGRLNALKKDGSAYCQELSLTPVRNKANETVNYVAVIRDGSEAEAIESRLRQSQKIEAIGTLAGGIAHDFNNILMAIMANAEIGTDSASDLDMSELKTYFQRIERASKRAEKLIRQILTFSCRNDSEKKVVELYPLVCEVCELMRATLPSTVKIKMKIDNRASQIFADASEIYQMLLNICTNASYAMQEKGGILRISLSSVDSSGEEIPDSFCSVPRLIKIEISDTGTGMEEAVMQRIFEPFFTTKKIGEGSGLGLSVVHGIVKNMNGIIKVKSEVGQGSCFSIYLPCHEDTGSGEHSEESWRRGKGEKIMFIDDEDAIVEIMKDVIVSLGYEVTALNSPEDAFRLFRKSPFDYDLIITDQTMPELTGEELCEKVLAIRPGMPVILCTGFSDRIDREKAMNRGVGDFLMKPVAKNILADSIHKLLKLEECMG